MSFTESKKIDTDSRLAIAQANQDNYRPTNRAVKTHLAEITLVLIVGPWAIGKSHTIRAILEHDTEFCELNNILTRSRRPHDPPGYRTDHSRETLLSRIESGEIVQYAIHPTTKDIYAADKDSYPTNYVVMPTLFSAVEQIKKLGFKQVIVFGLLADSKTWEKQLKERAHEPQKEQRLKEAKQCINWLLQQRDNVLILENKTDQAHLNAQLIIEIARPTTPPQVTANTARITQLGTELLEVIEKKLKLLKTSHGL